VITQMKIGRIGLAAFLNKIRVPGVESSTYQCVIDWAREIAAYVIAHCPRFSKVRHWIADPHTGRINI